MFAVQHGQRDIVLKMDLNGEETPKALLEAICKKAGVEQKDIEPDVETVKQGSIRSERGIDPSR